MDTACARVAISQHAVPAEVDDSRRRIEALETESRIITREKTVGIDIGEREAKVNQSLGEEKTRLAELEARWEKEKALVDRLLEVRQELRGTQSKVEGTDSELEQAADAAGEASAESGDNADASENEAKRAELLEELHKLQADLQKAQGELPLILPTVDEQAVGSVVADWTGIPVGRMVKDEVQPSST